MIMRDVYQKMKAPGDIRPTWLGGVIQVHITRACDLSCTGCTQGSNLAGKPVMMSVDQFEEAVLSLQDYHGVVGVFGGNPTTHPDFEEMCRIIEGVIPYERRGLWSNNLNGYGKLCREIFNPAYSNLNVHTDIAAYDEMKRDWPESQPKGLNDSRHSPPFVALKDMTDLTDDQRWELISNCDINQFWSAMICSFRGELRGYFCELAGAQSMLHQNEKDYPDTGKIINKGWWRSPIVEFEEQIKKHCFDCGIPLRGMGDLAVNGQMEYVSKTHEKIYKLKRPKGKKIEIVDNTIQLNGTVNRATDYIENGVIMQDVRVLIGVPTMEMARQASFYDNFNALEKLPGTMCTFSHGQSPARSRNLIIDQAITNHATHILFLDDDVAFKPDMLMNLLKHNVDIVTGLYLMRNYPHLPIIFDRAEADGSCLHHYPEQGKSGLIEIMACGLGACLIKTKVFDELQKPYIRLGELEPDHWCDDIGFFRRVRQAGIKIHCDLDTRVGHMATVTVYPDMQNGQWHTSYDTGGSSRVSFLSPRPVMESV